MTENTRQDQKYLNSSSKNHKDSRPSGDYDQEQEANSVVDVAENCLNQDESLLLDAITNEAPVIYTKQVRTLSLESIDDSSTNAAENEDSSSFVNNFEQAKRSQTDRKSVDKMDPAELNNSSSLKSENSTRSLKSVKFNPDRAEATERLFIKVPDELRFSNGRGDSMGVPKFVPSSKPQPPFKCNCVRFQSPVSFVDEYSCCPKHCPTRQTTRPRRSSGYSHFDDRSSSRSSTSADRGDRQRPFVYHQNFVHHRNSAARFRVSEQQHNSNRPTRVKPTYSLNWQHSGAYERRGTNGHHSQSQSKQLLVPFYQSDFHGHPAGNYHELSDESMLSRDRVRYKFSSRGKRSSLPEFENEIEEEEAEDYYSRFEEVLKQFSDWNSSLADTEAQQKADEFMKLAQPLLNWIASKGLAQREEETKTTSRDIFEKNHKKNKKRLNERVEEMTLTDKRVEQIKCRSSNEYHHPEIHVQSSLHSASSLSSPSCPSFSSQTTASIPNERIECQNQSSNLAQNILGALEEEFNLETQSKRLSGDADLSTTKLEFYQKKIVDLSSELNEIKNKNKSKQSKKFKIVVRSEYEALKLQLQAFREDYKLEHAEKEYYSGLCQQYAKKIRDLEDLMHRQMPNSFKISGVQTSALNESDSKTLDPSPKGNKSSSNEIRLNSASSDLSVDLKSLASIGADFF